MLICSSCNIPLCRIEYEGATVHVCPDCRGALVESTRLTTISRTRERTWTDDEKRRIETDVLEAPVRGAYRCPRCLMTMQQMGMPMGEGRFVLDYCKPCRLYWLDRGELELAQILFEEQRDGRTPEERQKIETQAGAEMPLKDEQAEIAGLPGEPEVTEVLGLEPERNVPPQDPDLLVRRVAAEQRLRDHAADVRFSGEVAKRVADFLKIQTGYGV